MATKNPATRKSIGRSLNFATGRINALCQRLLDPYDLTLPQWVILSCLWRDGDLTVGTLSAQVGTGLPATSRIVERMEDRGLVFRRKHETDGRVSVVSLTDDGERLSHLSDFHERINDMLFEGLSEEEQAFAFSLLQRLHANAEHALGQA